MLKSKTKHTTKSSINIKTLKPKEYEVYLLNDNYTTWNFVIIVLIDIFNKTENEAEEITMLVHNFGEGLCGTYSQEIAKTKVSEVIHLAELNKQPLKAIARLKE